MWIVKIYFGAIYSATKMLLYLKLARHVALTVVWHAHVRFHTWCSMLWIMFLSFSSHNYDTCLWYYLSKESDYRNRETFKIVFLMRSNLSFLYLNVTSRLHFVLNCVLILMKAPFNCRLWQWYILQFTLDLSWCSERIYFPKERLLPSFISVVWDSLPVVSFLRSQWILLF